MSVYSRKVESNVGSIGNVCRKFVVLVMDPPRVLTGHRAISVHSPRAIDLTWSSLGSLAWVVTLGLDFFNLEL